MPAAGRAQAVPSPEEFFGFQMGADRHLARDERQAIRRYRPGQQ